MVSKCRISVSDGHAYVQPSLTRYYQALLAMTGQARDESGTTEDAWLPIRSFDQQALVANDGSSVLARLAQECSYVVVEDQDLRAEDVLRHMRTFCLNQLAVLDMTQAMALTSNYSYLIWKTAEPMPSMAGTRIW